MWHLWQQVLRSVETTEFYYSLRFFLKSLKQVKDFRDIKAGIKHTQHVHLKIV